MTSSGTARFFFFFSAIATMIDFVSGQLASRALLSSRARVRGAGQRAGDASRSSRRRLVAHSATTRNDLRKPGSTQTAPEFSTILTARFPFRLQAIEPGLKTTRPGTERIGVSATDDFADEFCRDRPIRRTDLLDTDPLGMPDADCIFLAFLRFHPSC